MKIEFKFESLVTIIKLINKSCFILHNSLDYIMSSKSKKCQIHIVEDHNEALHHIYSAIGSKKLPVQNNQILHFDSHPDLGLPRRLKGECCRSGREVLEFLNIENWILPAVAAGFITKVFWIKPPWSQQLNDGCYKFSVGDDVKTGNIRLNAKAGYFMSDALFCKNLINSNDVILDVSNMEQFETTQITTPYILDIDLDYITVDDPFAKMYEGTSVCEQLEKLYAFQVPETESDEDWEDCNNKREIQLDELEQVFSHLQLHRTLDTWKSKNSEIYDLIRKLKVELLKVNVDEQIDWHLVHDAGCTRDHGGLPKHLSTKSEIKLMILQMECFLKKLTVPSIVTIARSSEDGYCPKEAVEDVQNAVVTMLQKTFNLDAPILHYLDT